MNKSLKVVEIMNKQNIRKEERVGLKYIYIYIELIYEKALLIYYFFQFLDNYLLTNSFY